MRSFARATSFPDRGAPRRGALLVEAALLLSAFLLILFAMLELGLVVMHYNSLAEAARTVAREAVVRGEMAPPRRAAWGPATYSGTAADGSEIAAKLRSILVGLHPQDVGVRVEWPDAGNAVGQRVRVTVVHRHPPVLRFVSGNDDYSLSAASVMRIAH